jgi:hypothetical protein
MSRYHRQKNTYLFKLVFAIVTRYLWYLNKALTNNCTMYPNEFEPPHQQPA